MQKITNNDRRLPSKWQSNDSAVMTNQHSTTRRSN
jgi:hypothetical protein